MRLQRAATFLLSAALLGGVSAEGAVILASDFDGNTGSLDVGNLSSNTGNATLTVAYTGSEAASGSVLTAVSPGGGFASGPNNATTDVATIGNNLNSGDRPNPRGYTLTFTPATDYSLGSFDVSYGHLNGGGGLQGFFSTLNVSISQGASVLFSDSDSSYARDDDDSDNGFPAPGIVPFSFDASGLSLVAGTEYTLGVNVTDLVGGGAFATFDGFSLNTIPEPGSLALLGLAGCVGLISRRK